MRRPSKNRKSPYSVMAHIGFGDLSIIKNNVKVTIPAEHLTANGAIKSSVKALLSDFTVENMTRLHSSFGVVFEKLA